MEVEMDAGDGPKGLVPFLPGGIHLSWGDGLPGSSSLTRGQIGERGGCSGGAWEEGGGSGVSWEGGLRPGGGSRKGSHGVGSPALVMWGWS